MRRFIIHQVKGDGETLQGVSFSSPLLLARDKSNFHVIKAGIASEGKTDYFGTFDQSEKTMLANVPFALTGDDDLGQLMDDSEVVVVDITTTGDPCFLLGSGVQSRVDLLGDDPENLFEAGPEKRTVQGIIRHIRSIGAGTMISNVTLAREFSEEDDD